MTAQCGGDHEGPCVNYGEALLSAAADGNTLILFALMADADEGILESLSEIGQSIYASAEAMKVARANHTPEEIEEARQGALLAASLGGTNAADMLVGVDDLLASLGLSTEDGQEPGQQG